MRYVVILLCDIFMILVTMQLYHDMLGEDKRKHGLKWCMGISWILCTFLVSEIFHIPLFNFALNLGLLLLLTLSYKGRYPLKIWAAVLAACLGALCDYFSYQILKSSMEEETAYVVSYVFTVILFWLCERIANILICKSRGESLSGKEFGILLSIPLCSLAVLATVTYSDMNSLYATLASAGILVICFMSFYVYHYLVRSMSEKADNELLEREIQWYSKELERVRETEQRIDGMRHDIKHHLIQIKDYANKGQMGQLEEYIREWEGDIPDNTRFSQSGQKEIDSLLNYMLEKAEMILTHIEVRVSVPNNLDINQYQVNIVLGNLLENAILAASKSNNKELKVIVEERQGLLYIEIGNSYNQYFVMKNGKLLTTKTDKKAHGFGLENVKRVVEMCDGEMDIQAQKEWFQVKILMYV